MVGSGVGISLTLTSYAPQLGPTPSPRACPTPSSSSPAAPAPSSPPTTPGIPRVNIAIWSPASVPHPLPPSDPMLSSNEPPRADSRGRSASSASIVHQSPPPPPIRPHSPLELVPSPHPPPQSPGARPLPPSVPTIPARAGSGRAGPHHPPAWSHGALAR